MNQTNGCNVSVMLNGEKRPDNDDVSVMLKGEKRPGNDNVRVMLYGEKSVHKRTFFVSDQQRVFAQSARLVRTFARSIRLH